MGPSRLRSRSIVAALTMLLTGWRLSTRMAALWRRPQALPGCWVTARIVPARANRTAILRFGASRTIAKIERLDSDLRQREQAELLSHSNEAVVVVYLHLLLGGREWHGETTHCRSDGQRIVAKERLSLAWRNDGETLLDSARRERRY
jgi:hypothetical protein